MNIVLDTSFILSIQNKDSNSKIARNLFSALDNDAKLIIPTVVVSECLISSENVENDLKNISKLSKQIEPTLEKDLKFFQNIPLEKRKTLKANDCVILAICKRYKAKLLTFDKKLDRAYIDLL